MKCIYDVKRLVKLTKNWLFSPLLLVSPTRGLTVFLSLNSCRHSSRFDGYNENSATQISRWIKNLSLFNSKIIYVFLLSKDRKYRDWFLKKKEKKTLDFKPASGQERSNWGHVFPKNPFEYKVGGVQVNFQNINASKWDNNKGCYCMRKITVVSIQSSLIWLWSLGLFCFLRHNEPNSSS